MTFPLTGTLFSCAENKQSLCPGSSFAPENLHFEAKIEGY